MDANEISRQVLELLRREATSYLENHREDALRLGESAVQAILRQQVCEHVPIPELPPEPTAAMIADREAIITERARCAQLIAAAEAKDARRVKRLQDSAARTATTVAGALAGIALGALKGLLQG